jgi:hypothetical protein
LMIGTRCALSIHLFHWVVWMYSNDTNKHFTKAKTALCTRASADVFGVQIQNGTITSCFLEFSVHRRRFFLLETVWKSLGDVAEQCRRLIWMATGCYMGGGLVLYPDPHCQNRERCLLLGRSRSRRSYATSVRQYKQSWQHAIAPSCK